MRRLFISILLIFCMTSFHAQPITVTPASGLSPDYFLNHFFAGEGVTLHDCKFNWSPSNINGTQVGTFANTNSNFPIASGILLTTGNINVAPGPNDEDGAHSSIGISSTTLDADLQALLSSQDQSITTTSVLEFSFHSGNNEHPVVSFNYVFASEEFPEYVCANVNDVFGFFLEGPDPWDCDGNPVKYNIAKIPGSNLPISINSVNPGVVGSYGQAVNCTPAQNGSLDWNRFYRSSLNGSSSPIQFDGYTVIRPNYQQGGVDTPMADDISMTAEALICPCREYKMKISIANVNDQSHDSGVFLEQGSFKLPKFLTVTDSISPSEMDHSISPDIIDTVIQNCSTADIQMHYGEPLGSNMTVVLISDGGTANQTDFNVLRFRDNGDIDTIRNGDSFLFLEGDTLLNLRMEVADSAIFAPNEAKTVQLVLKSILCPQFRYLDPNRPLEERAQYDTLNYVIVGNKRFTLTSDSVFYCDRCTHVAIQMKGGTEPLRYNWTPDTSLATPHAKESNCNITESTTFQVTVSDRWGCLVDTCYHTALITSTPVLEGHYHISPNVICVPEEVQFKSTATPASTHRWIIYSNNMRDTIYGNDQTYTFTAPGHYSIDYMAYEALACAANVSLVNYINAGLKPTALFSFDPMEAEVGDTVYFTNESSGLDVHYNWSFGDGSNNTEENPIHVYYSENNYNVILTVSDDAGCSDMYTLPVPVVDNHVLYVPNSFTPNKDELNDVFLPVVACVDPTRYYLVVYDRNGSIVFATNNTEMGWDGTINGKECPSGVYTYFISYYRYNNLKQELLKTGKINLIR